MSAQRTMIPALAMFLGLCASAHAGIIVNTIGVGGDTLKPLAGGASAESFIATSTGLGDIELALSKTSAASTGSVVITIRADTGSNKPSSTVLDTIATVLEQNIPTGSESLFDFYNISLANPLTIGSRYFINVTYTGINSADVYTTAIAPSVGTASTVLAAGNTDYSYAGGAGTTSSLMMICISTDGSCAAANGAIYSSVNTAAPEPASVAIVGAGLTGLGWVRRRKPGRSSRSGS